MAADDTKVPSIKEFQEKVAILELSINELMTQRNNAMNENASLKVQLKILEARLTQQAKAPVLSLKTNPEKPNELQVSTKEDSKEGRSVDAERGSDSGKQLA